MDDFFSPQPTERTGSSQSQFDTSGTTAGGFDRTTGGGFDQTSGQALAPWDPAAAGLTNIAQGAGGLAGTSQQYFPDQTFISQTPEQMAILQNQFSQAGGFGAGIVDPAMQAWQSQLAGPNRDTFRNALDVYGADVGRQFERNILPAVKDQFVMGGGRRSSRAGIAEGLAAGEATDAIARYGAGLEMDFQRLGSQNQQFALGAAPGMMNLAQAPGQLQYGIQDQMQLDPRRQLNEDIARFDFGQNQGQWGNLYNAFNLLQPMAGQFGTMTGGQAGTQFGEQAGTTFGETTSMGTQTGVNQSLQTGGGPSPFAQIAGVGLTAAGLASGNPFAAMGGMGGGSIGGGGGFNPFSLNSAIQNVNPIGGFNFAGLS